MADQPAKLAAKTLTTLAEVESISTLWLALEERCDNALTYFQTYVWCRNWIAIFCGIPGQPVPHVRTVWRGDELVCVWPLMISGGGVRRMENLGDPHSQYCNILSLPEADVARDAVAELLLVGLLERSACDVAVFKPVPMGSGLENALSRIMPPIRGYANQASVLDLAQYNSSADYSAKLGKVQKRNRNRRRNHLARLGALDFRVIWPDNPEYAPLVRQAAAMKRRWLAGTSRYSAGFSMAEYEEFLAQLSGDAAALAGACLSVLRAGDRVVALELGFIRKRHYYAYLGGFDWELRGLSPGKVQMDMTVGWLIDNGISAYDLLANPAEYKKSWSNQDIALGGFAAPLTWRGHFYAEAWLPVIRPAIKRLHGMISEMVRRLIVFGQGVTCLVIYI